VKLLIVYTLQVNSFYSAILHIIELFDCKILQCLISFTKVFTVLQVCNCIRSTKSLQNQDNTFYLIVFERSCPRWKMKDQCFRKPDVCDSIESEDTSSLVLSTSSSMSLIEHKIQEIQVLQGIQWYKYYRRYRYFRRYRDTGTTGDTRIKGYREYSDTVIRGHRDTGMQVLQGIQGYRDTGTQGYSDIGIQTYRDTGIHDYSDSGIQGYMDTGIQGYRYYRNTGIQKIICIQWYKDTTHLNKVWCEINLGSELNEWNLKKTNLEFYKDGSTKLFGRRNHPNQNSSQCFKKSTSTWKESADCEFTDTCGLRRVLIF